ncbi:ribosome assembly RNA-binding protein YhbY [Mariprofundus sp. KV]|uniref:ribosome assembly RNA-binding protein YhbY n=1 Tax=Mariprofundus sp. KV TaxID=2608715 RepID=UPI0015A060CC|nr:ribosome assembly RNA-binding protein YhbY [Mariprofundus sp. KV]NWF37330.1 ribosome assembly RNA-binding protein YhbY [Mariprofundus sp. KV]
MALNNKQIAALKTRAHPLKPVIRIGQKGITENLIAETELALNIHELIKVHIAEDDRTVRKAAGETLAAKTGAEIVNYIGKVCTLYRKKESDS